MTAAPEGQPLDSPPPALWPAAERYLRISTSVVQTATIAALAAMALINVLEIVWRLIRGGGLNWVQELSVILAMIVYFLAYSLIAKREDYIRVEALIRRCSPEGRQRLDRFARLAVLAFQAFVFVFTIKTMRFVAAFETSVLSLPEWIFFAPLVLASADIVVTEAIYFFGMMGGRAPTRVERHDLLT